MWSLLLIVVARGTSHPDLLARRLHYRGGQRTPERRRPGMTQTMKAWFTVPGPEGAVFELRETPVPSPGPGQVLVAVRAAGVNRGELIRGAQVRSANPSGQPTRAGRDVAGESAA